MNRSVVIVGRSGHGSVIEQIIRNSGDHVFGWLDDDDTKAEKTLGKISDACKFRELEFIIAIGGNRIRKMIAEQIASFNIKFYTAIHPLAILADDISIGEGSVVMANAVINPGAKIGKHCIVNTAAIIEHDCKLHDYVHISPNATLGGGVTVGEQTHIGIGSTVIQNINICKQCLVGAGAVVVKSLVRPGTYVGVPARKIK